jgi:hypothetical protein
MHVALPGGRDARGTLDEPVDGDDDACVVACPPHPRMGGSRSDARLRAASDALTDRGVACLRFDYGPWDGGRGERRDAAAGVAWARERFDRVGLFGYSFGASVALLAAAEAGPAAASALAPAARIGSDPELDVPGAIETVDCPVQVVYGERDDAVDWAPVVERARALGHRVDAVSGDHHFVGQGPQVGELVAEFLVGHLSGA